VERESVRLSAAAEDAEREAEDYRQRLARADAELIRARGATAIVEQVKVSLLSYPGGWTRLMHRDSGGGGGGGGGSGVREMSTSSSQQYGGDDDATRQQQQWRGSNSYANDNVGRVDGSIYDSSSGYMESEERKRLEADDMPSKVL
jgi:hypothetical protein